MNLVAIDIGSTWTKGVRFEIEPESENVRENVRIAARAARPTTVDNLGDGFFALLGELVSGDPLAQLASGAVQLQYSSSAKGGLAVAAIGLVPEVTLEIGKTAAQSAGAKLTQVFSYRLTRRDIAGLEAAPPDILLFAGGTDGGNTEYVLANAQAIAASKIDCEIVYAGNRAAADEVAEILASKRLRVVDNLLPNFNEPNPEPAREAIRAIFLETIVKGKGLDRIMRATGAEPVPTPYAVYEYVRAIHEHVPGWQDFMLFDMGGATTDVYSAHRETPSAGTLLRGLPEPEIKRSVEGDLGMPPSIVGDDALKKGNGIVARQADAQQSRHLGPAEEGCRLVVLPQDVAGIAEQHLAVGGQVERTALLAEQRPADEILEAAHLQRDRRLRAAERDAGLGEAAEIHDRDEGAEQVGLQVHQRGSHFET